MSATVPTTRVVFRNSIHLWDGNQEGSWDNKSSYVDYTDLLMELLLLGLDLLHHVHMLVTLLLQVFSNIWLSMASLVSFMQLRFLVQKRIRRHRNDQRVRRKLHLFTVESADELAASNDLLGCDEFSPVATSSTGRIMSDMSDVPERRGRR